MYAVFTSYGSMNYGVCSYGSYGQVFNEHPSMLIIIKGTTLHTP